MTGLLGPAEIRELAARLGVAPTKKLGQNFVHDPNTVRRIVNAAGLAPDDVALEVGPGLGSLTLALLPVAGHVHAVEIDPVLDDELRLEGRVFDLTHAVNVLRKERGLEVSDRIRLELAATDSDLLERYRERIAEETLAVEIEVGGSLDLRKA